MNNEIIVFLVITHFNIFHFFELSFSHRLFILLIHLFVHFFFNALLDFCRDESDCSDGYTTDGFATIDVMEYEVDDSSDSEDLESHNSSSGTDVRILYIA